MLSEEFCYHTEMQKYILVFKTNKICGKNKKYYGK